MTTEVINILNSLKKFYLPPWPGMCWLYSHWTTLGSRPCSHRHQHHSTEHSEWLGTPLHLSPGPAADTWGRLGIAQPHPLRRWWCWSMRTWAPSFVPNRNPGHHEFVCHNYRAKSHCARWGRWLWSRWSVLWKTSVDQTTWYNASCNFKMWSPRMHPYTHTHTNIPLYPQA